MSESFKNYRQAPRTPYYWGECFVLRWPLAGWVKGLDASIEQGIRKGGIARR